MTPEESRQKFESAIQELREAFDRWMESKEAQFDQLLEVGWSGTEVEDVESFVTNLKAECERLREKTATIEDDVQATNSVVEEEREIHEMEDRAGESTRAEPQSASSEQPKTAQQLIEDGKKAAEEAGLPPLDFDPEP